MNLKRRSWVVGAVVLAGSVLAGCEFFVQTVAPTPTLITAPPSQLQRPMVAVELGTLEEAIRMTGRVEADERSDLFFKAPGRVKNVAVRQGDEIEAGAIIAELETGGLESQVADAQKALETAGLRLTAAESRVESELGAAEQTLLLAVNDLAAKQLALDNRLAGATEVDLAAARAAVSTAKVRVNALVGGPTESQIASARASISTAASAFNARRTDLASVEAALPETIAASGALVSQREAEVAAAQMIATDLRAKGVPTDSAAAAEAESTVSALEANVEAQRSVFFQAEADLSDLKNRPTPPQLLAAENTFEKAKLTHDLVMRGRGSFETKQQAEIDFQEAIRAYNDALAPATEADIRDGTNTVATARASLLDLEAQFQALLGSGTRSAAIQRLAAQVKTDFANELSAAEVAAAGAELSLAQARHSQSVAEGPLGPIEVQRARDSYNDAGSNLGRAQAALRELEKDPDEQELLAAEEGLINAEEKLAELIALPKEADVQAARNALEATQINERIARRELERMESGDSPARIDLTIQQNAVQQAAIKLERLMEQTFENQIIAPFAGEVTFVRGRPGDQVAAYQEVIGLANPNLLVVEAVVPEIDQSKLAVGQEVDVTIDQFAGVIFVGRVETLPRTIISSTGQSIKIPETKIVVAWNQPGVELGMLARLKITIQVRENVLKVPISSVRTVNQREFVETIIGGQRRSVPVTTGAASDTEIEILDGLEEGTMIFATP